MWHLGEASSSDPTILMHWQPSWTAVPRTRLDTDRNNTSMEPESSMLADLRKLSEQEVQKIEEQLYADLLESLDQTEHCFDGMAASTATQEASAQSDMETSDASNVSQQPSDLMKLSVQEVQNVLSLIEEQRYAGTGREEAVDEILPAGPSPGLVAPPAGCGSLDFCAFALFNPFESLDQIDHGIDVMAAPTATQGRSEFEAFHGEALPAPPDWGDGYAGEGFPQTSTGDDPFFALFADITLTPIPKERQGKYVTQPRGIPLEDVVRFDAKLQGNLLNRLDRTKLPPSLLPLLDPEQWGQIEALEQLLPELRQGNFSTELKEHKAIDITPVSNRLKDLLQQPASAMPVTEKVLSRACNELLSQELDREQLAQWLSGYRSGYPEFSGAAVLFLSEEARRVEETNRKQQARMKQKNCPAPSGAQKNLDGHSPHAHSSSRPNPY